MLKLIATISHSSLSPPFPSPLTSNQRQILPVPSQTPDAVAVGLAPACGVEVEVSGSSAVGCGVGDEVSESTPVACGVAVEVSGSTPVGCGVEVEGSGLTPVACRVEVEVSGSSTLTGAVETGSGWVVLAGKIGDGVSVSTAVA